MEEETNMSTKIDDLPIPDIDKEIDNQNDNKNEKIELFENDKTDTIIKSSKQYQKISIFKTITNEINEENVFLLVLFFLISISDINKYFVNIPFLGNYFEYESWTFILFKSVFFLIVFIIGKMFLLPKIAI
jgi:hypothetical protein